jgi:hypothetical protein
MVYNINWVTKTKDLAKELYAQELLNKELADEELKKSKDSLNLMFEQFIKVLNPFSGILLRSRNPLKLTSSIFTHSISLFTSDSPNLINITLSYDPSQKTAKVLLKLDGKQITRDTELLNFEETMEAIVSHLAPKLQLSKTISA